MRKIGLIILVLGTIGTGFVCPLFPETITFLHSNDTHGIFKPYRIKASDRDRLVGGMEAVSHYLNQVRAKDRNVVYIDGGDIMTGTLAASIEYKGVVGGVMIEFLNMLDCDIWAYGNHEFDKGPLKALGLVNLAKFPAITANIIYRESGKLFSPEPFHILTKAGLRIGIIAVMEESFMEEVHRERIKDLDVLPLIPTLNSYVPALERQTDLIVALVHSSFEDGQRVAREVPGVDIVLTASEEGKFKNVNGVLVKSTFGHQQTLGYLKVEVGKGKIENYDEKLIWLWADVPLEPSAAITDLVIEVDTMIGREYQKVIGEAKVNLTPSTFPEKNSRVESNLGDWIADVMRWKTGVQVGLHNSGALRNSIPAGPITIANIFEVCPFRNTLVVFKLTGRQIKDILESDIERNRDRMQVSGLTYKYYPRDEKPFGERVYSVEVNGEVLVKKGEVMQPEKLYSVVSNDYVVVQAEAKYFGFPVENPLDTRMPLDQALIEWLETHKLLDYKPSKRIEEIGK